MSYPPFIQSRNIKIVNGDGAGTYSATIPYTAPADIAALYTISLEANVGDVVWAQFACTWYGGSGNEAGFYFAYNGVTDVFATHGMYDTNGANQCFNVYQRFRALTPSDISGGQVVIKPRWETNNGVGYIRNDGVYGVPQFVAMNLGPVDPT